MGNLRRVGRINGSDVKRSQEGMQMVATRRLVLDPINVIRVLYKR